MKKTILITGAGSGIGKDAAFALAMRGHTVIATTETDEQAVQLLDESHSRGAVFAQTLKLDITLELDRQKVRDFDLDVLINNAGIGETGSLAEVPMDRLRKNFEVNVFSALALTQLALEGMMAKKKGTVIFVSSLAGRTPIPFLSPYGMTKYALSGGAAALREELHRVAKDVHVSLIEPGTYATGFNQRMVAKKYEWMDEHSYFFGIIPKLRAEDARIFGTFEEKHTASIVQKIVQAAEARKPHIRYVAPAYQGIGIALLRIFGR